MARAPEADPDWELVARVADGEIDAFEPLVACHQERLLRVCERLLGDREAARDATQEVFLKAFRKAGALEPQGRFFTWLYRVAVNHCLNRLRRRRLVRFVSFAGEREEGGGPAEPPAPGADPEQALAARRRWQATRRALGRLPETQRAVLVLARFEGLSYRQIAAALEITEAAVESRLFRALRALERAQESAPPGVDRGEER